MKVGRQELACTCNIVYTCMYPKSILNLSRWTVPIVSLTTCVVFHYIYWPKFDENTSMLSSVSVHQLLDLLSFRHGYKIQQVKNHSESNLITAEYSQL